MFQRDAGSSLQLFINRVLVMSDCDLLLPPYLRFVQGVVDANDLSLNVSRELLQRDRHIAVVNRRLTKSVLGAIKAMRDNDPERYATCWTHYGRALKEGLISDYDDRSTLLQLSSFASTHDDVELTTLAAYVQRMQDNHHHIYYATGESRAMIQNSPHMEVLTAKGIEVLLLTDPIDEI
jgi:molecular chaperone HtpG